MSANSELLEQYVERYNAGDLEGCMEFYADDAVQLMADGVFEGKQAIHDRLGVELAAFDDATYTVLSFVEQGDVFADEWLFTGTHTGAFPLPDGTQIPGTGNSVKIRGMELVRIRDGRIVVDNLYYDLVGALAQLGLLSQGVAA